MTRARDERVIERGEWVWRVRPELAGRVPEWEAALTTPAGRREARTVKATDGRRTIWRMTLPGAGEVFVKHYSTPRLVKRVKHLVRNSRTRQEWEMGLTLEGLGLPVARHLAMAERRPRGLLAEDLLVEEALIGYRNFDAWFAAEWGTAVTGAGARARHEAVARLAELIRRMHDAGVLQRDFKPDSVMVGPEGEFRLVDLERALIVGGRRGLGREARRANLAKIDQTFGFIASADDRLRFLRSYHGEPPPRMDALMADLSWRAEREWRKRARDARTWAARSNETYAHYALGPYRIIAHRSLHREFMMEMVAAMERGLDPRAAHVCSWGPRGPAFPLTARWGDATTALENTASLYDRKAPFVPARAAILPGGDRFGLCLSLRPEPALPGWTAAAAAALAAGQGAEFGAELGRFLRILDRMGIGFARLGPATLVHDREAPWPRLYLHDLDELIFDRSPAEKEGRARLREIAWLLALPAEAAAAMRDGYERCRVRWFPGPERW
jgi:hypothetical protein